MKKKLELKTSTVLFIGLLLVCTGIFMISSEYLVSKREKAFSEMNIKLFESEMPENIDTSKTPENTDSNPDTGDNTEEEPTDTVDTKPTPTPTPSTGTVSYLGVLEIPKINLKRGFFDLNSNRNRVSRNVTVIRGSTYPDEENNNLILAAHSGNCSYCYFDKLYKLKLGDLAYLTYGGKKYTYKIANIYTVEKTGEVAIFRDSSKSTLTLITCTRGSSHEQYVYILALQ